ncbi:MAG: imidazoleglycerol-phosphate dehydratase HisB [Albidovulum sp.]|nr:imidazoleglycerol-phosphate dehydratase HisB [Albidovulum sp.]MDE0304526.1 imidazoleglycerol-phosphate dehydratase HisB [Albidovulum sp.]MDE0531431.1 imidazoleglycerol-phosphate dehydratase HisB [Albidovulum sp.]
MRKVSIERRTNETDVKLELNLDGSGKYKNETGIGFLDHMLDQFARHSLIDLLTNVRGDIEIDFHHTVEDTGIVLGQALAQALGDKKGIQRYGFFSLVMDDALVATALDAGGRSFLAWDVEFPTEKIGSFDTELLREFFQSLCANGGIALHARLLNGTNSHHIAEATVKSVARSLRMAISYEPRSPGELPSTKGTL